MIDAIPCDAIIYQNGFWYWYGVSFAEDKFFWKAGKPVEQALLPESLLSGNFSEDYVTELHPQANAWIRQIAKQLDLSLIHI